MVPPFDLSQTLLVGGGLLVPCSLPGPSVIKQLMQMVTMVPGQGGRLQCASPDSLTRIPSHGLLGKTFLLLTLVLLKGKTEPGSSLTCGLARLGRPTLCWRAPPQAALAGAWGPAGRLLTLQPLLSQPPGPSPPSNQCPVVVRVREATSEPEHRRCIFALTVYQKGKETEIEQTSLPLLSEIFLPSIKGEKKESYLGK